MPYHYETIATIILLTIYIRKNHHWYEMHYCDTMQEAQAWLSRNSQYPVWKITDIDNRTILTSK